MVNAPRRQSVMRSSRPPLGLRERRPPAPRGRDSRPLRRARRPGSSPPTPAARAPARRGRERAGRDASRKSPSRRPRRRSCACRSSRQISLPAWLVPSGGTRPAPCNSRGGRRSRSEEVPMALAAIPGHWKRYKDIAWLLAKHGRSDLVRDLNLEDGETPPLPSEKADADELARDLE